MLVKRKQALLNSRCTVCVVWMAGCSVAARPGKDRQQTPSYGAAGGEGPSASVPLPTKPEVQVVSDTTREKIRRTLNVKIIE